MDDNIIAVYALWFYSEANHVNVLKQNSLLKVFGWWFNKLYYFKILFDHSLKNGVGDGRDAP